MKKFDIPAARQKREQGRMYATRFIALGFILTIILGGLLLTLPWASANGISVGFFDALFTSTSAVCVTGLTVLETGAVYSLFGQIVILALIQVGGLGFMTIITLIFVILGRKITIRDRLLIQESMNENNIGGMVRLIIWVVKVTLVCELTGAVIMSTRFIPEFGWARGTYYSVFHSVSAFCNAGFDVLGEGVSLARYATDPIISLTLTLLIIISGLGFGAINDICVNRRFSKLHLHTKLVLVTVGILISTGTIFVLAVEWNNPDTLGAMNVPQKLMAALFQSVTFRTAGFATVNQNLLEPSTKFIGSILMFIGAAPASTGGGIKLTTLAVLVLMSASVVKGNAQVAVFGRSIPREILQRAASIFLIGLTVLVTDIAILSIFEPEYNFIDIIFECASALGTTGLSALGTANLGTPARIVIILAMFIGRIGPLSMTLAIAHRQQQAGQHLSRPEEKVVVG